MSSVGHLIDFPGELLESPPLFPDTGWMSEKGQIRAPGDGFWSRFSTEAQAVRHITAIPKIKGILGSIKHLWHSESLVKQNLRDLLTLRTFLSELCEKEDVDPAIKRFMALQALSLIVAYREPDLFNSHFHSFTFDFPNEWGEPVTYRLSDIIDLGGGMKAFGFVPDVEGKPPLLLYHGTFPFPGAPGHLASVMADFEKEGAGFATFRKNKEAIEAWLKENAPYRNVIVSGHSLGGSFGIYTGVFLADYVKEATVFNAPGVNRETYETWKSYCREIPWALDTTQIDVFNDKGDIVPRYGGDYTVGKVYEGSHEDVSPSIMNELELHNAPLFLKQAGFVYQLQKQKEVQTQDLRFFILSGMLVLPVGGLLAGLAILISNVIIPVITSLVVAGTWPVLIAAMAGALIAIALASLIHALVKRGQEKQIEQMKHILGKPSEPYRTIDALRRDLAIGRISAREFAYYYKTQFYSPESGQGIFVPFKVALLREIAFVFRVHAQDTALMNIWAPKTQEEALQFLFHPEKYLERVCSQVSDSISEIKVRQAWDAIKDPLFFRALGTVKK